jgi:hypothetical protein
MCLFLPSEPKIFQLTIYLQGYESQSHKRTIKTIKGGNMLEIIYDAREATRISHVLPRSTEEQCGYSHSCEVPS